MLLRLVHAIDTIDDIYLKSKLQCVYIKVRNISKEEGGAKYKLPQTDLTLKHRLQTAKHFLYTVCHIFTNRYLNLGNCSVTYM